MSGKPFKPSETDFRIGKTLQILRAKQGLSQKNLAALLGVSFQQVQKYECGGNRISAARLYDIAQVLQVPIGALYNESKNEPMHNKEMMDLIHRIYKLSDDDRKLLTKVVHRLGQ